MAEQRPQPRRSSQPGQQPRPQPLQQVERSYPLTGQFPAKRPSIPAIKGLDGDKDKLAK